MAQLPFPFNPAEFHPLQPEDSEAELRRRTDPKYAHLYVNVAQRYFESSNAPAFTGKMLEDPEATVVNDYAEWVATCKRMDEETEAAKSDWRMAVLHKDAELSRLKTDCELKRQLARQLELRPKPPQPRSARKGS